MSNININQAQQQLANSLNKIAHYHVQRYAQTLAKGNVPTTKQTEQTATAVQAADAAGANEGNPQTANAANVAANEINKFIEAMRVLPNSNVRNKTKRNQFRSSIQKYINQGNIRKNNVQNILKRFNNANSATGPPKNPVNNANSRAAGPPKNPVNNANSRAASNSTIPVNNANIAARRPPTNHNTSGNGTS